MRHLAWKYMPAINWLMQDVLRSLLSRQWMVSRDFLPIIPGEMRFEDADGNEYVFAVSSGFVEMINNRAKLFCLSVESPDEIDIRRAQEAKERAEEQLRQKQSIQEYHMNQMALARAMTRLKVTHKQ